MRYEEAGVHIEAKAEALRRAREAIAATYTPEVLRGMGAFGGLYAASRLKALEEPVLVATTDGVGTKTLLALEAGDVSGLGFDLVNHSVNDLLAQGAEPLSSWTTWRQAAWTKGCWPPFSPPWPRPAARTASPS